MNTATCIICTVTTINFDMKTLTINTIYTSDNRDAQILLEQLLDVAKEANYEAVYDSFRNATYTIDEAIKHFSIL